METEIRYYYSFNSKEKIIEYLKQFKELKYQGRFYECTDQYNHPMKKYNFYSKKIDGRFRIRKTTGNNKDKCMITWKRRLKNNIKQLIHQEEEIELQINPNEYEKLCLLLENVLHLTLVESYERYRSIFCNKEIEIVVDEYPFGICIELENKSKNKDATTIITTWLNKLKFDINKAYRLSWDDKYSELCQGQNIPIENIVRFNKKMPIVKEEFKI